MPPPTHLRCRARRVALAVLPLCGFGSGCEPDHFLPSERFPGEFGGPQGVIAGSVTYTGPPPCTQGGRIVGAAVLLAFEEALLPPPEGLGTQPFGLELVSGEQLFRGRRAELAFADDGSLLCPRPGDPSMTVTADFAISPLPAGVYQVRGYYDHDGNFDPTFSLFNLPTRGDVAGGAIENVQAVLLDGAPPRFRSFPLGDVSPDGERIIGELGAFIEGAAVTLALPLPLDRPTFHLSGVSDERQNAAASERNDDPDNVVVPSDYQLNLFDVADPARTEQSFIRLVVRAGVPEREVTHATGNPYFFDHLTDPSLVLSRQDTNRDGVLDDTIPETTLVPALAPQAVLSKRVPGEPLASQVGPSIILQGVTLRDNLLSTVAASAADFVEIRDELVVGLRPAVLCIDVGNPGKPAVLLNTHPTDVAGNVLIADEEALEASLAERFGRPVGIQYGCLPEGEYGMNLVYDTGQAWSLPNEAGVCDTAHDELLSADGSRCGIRPRLASQSVMIRVGPPQNAAYCDEHPTPAACVPAQ